MENDSPAHGTITEAYINLNEIAVRHDNYGLQEIYSTGHELRLRLVGSGLEVRMDAARIALDQEQAKSLADWLQHHIR